MYACVHAHEYASIDAHLEARGQLGKLVLSFHSVASESATQVIRFWQQVLLPTEPSYISGGGFPLIL